MSFKLNENQKKAVYYDGLKPLLIIASAGSGKTRVMTERVKYLLERGEDPESFLICTFSTKAANELKERLIDYSLNEDSIVTKNDINKMQISTIHSFCLKLLDEKGMNYDIYDDDYSEKRLMFIYKHKEDLGFINEAYISRSQTKAIAEKFSEYLEFGLNEEEYIKYLNKEKPISQEYLNFIKENMIDGKFPYDEINENEEFKESWKNAKHLQTVKAFSKYLKLLEENMATDYSFMQYKALEELKKEPQTRYKHILVDEFQDTDPSQYQIFKILIDEALKNNKEGKIKGSFTAVGDMNQKIYGFRGAVKDYFKKLYESMDCKVLPLNINHRSTEKIVKLSEELIKESNESISEEPVTAFRNDVLRDSYYLKNENTEEEGEKIANLIDYLIKNKKAEYKDILILFRSVYYDSGDLIEAFDKHKIPYHARGLGSLKNNDAVKSIITLIDYIVQIDEGVPIVSDNWKWLTLKAFTNTDYNPIFNLSDETQEIICNIQDEYESEVVEVGKGIQTGFDVSQRRSYNGMMKHNDEIKELIFAEVKRPILTNEVLIESGVTNEEDLKFFKTLNQIKSDLNEKEFDEREDILTIYYKILDLCGYLTNEIINDEENKENVENIALLTNTINNYQDMVSPTDIRGFYWYLRSNIENYGSNYLNEEGVQIMNVHQSKGLEYPITILASLIDEKFPKKYKDESIKPSYKQPFYTPNKFLTKKIPHEEEEANHNAEEERVLYVGMTRAVDTLILSTAKQKTSKRKNKEPKEEMPKKIKKLIDENEKSIKELNNNNFTDVEKIEKSREIDQNSKLTLSYSSINTYEACPFSYYLRNETEFITTNGTEANYGIIIHDSLDKINKLVKEGKTDFSKEELTLIVSKAYNKHPEIEINPFKKQEMIENVIYYWKNYGKNIKVLDSEYKFNIYEKDYTLIGAIDLIYECEDGSIGIIDYKNAFEITDYKKEKYKKQIYTYALALTDDPIYANKKISTAKIYATFIRKVIDIDLNEFNAEKTLKEINKTSNDIKNSEEFEQRIKDHCQWCPYNFICLEKRCPKCGAPMLDNKTLCYNCEKVEDD